jgi:hypothetical protein
VRRPSIEVYQGNDYEKNTLNLVCKCLGFRGTLKAKAKCLSKNVFHTPYNMAVIDSERYQKDILV